MHNLPRHQPQVGIKSLLIVKVDTKKGLRSEFFYSLGEKRTSTRGQRCLGVPVNFVPVCARRSALANRVTTGLAIGPAIGLGVETIPMTAGFGYRGPGNERPMGRIGLTGEAQSGSMDMKVPEMRAPMSMPVAVAVKHAMGGLLACVLILGPGVTLHDHSAPSKALPLPPAAMVLGLAFSKAHADSKRRKRTRQREAAQRRAEEKRQKEADKILEGSRRATLPANCAYDSYASFTSPSDIYVCGGSYYQRFEEDGVTGFEGHGVGLDRGAIDAARARRAKAEKERRAEAEKTLKANRKTALSADCVYDSYASFITTSNVYTCGGVQFMQYEENGVAVYDRRTAGGNGGKSKGAKARAAKAAKKRRGTRRATLPKGCAYDTYASFFTSSNVYACNGVRYRQYTEKGAIGYEVFDL